MKVGLSICLTSTNEPPIDEPTIDPSVLDDSSMKKNLVKKIKDGNPSIKSTRQKKTQEVDTTQVSCSTWVYQWWPWWVMIWRAISQPACSHFWLAKRPALISSLTWAQFGWSRPFSHTWKFVKERKEKLKMKKIKNEVIFEILFPKLEILIIIDRF